MAIFWLLYGYIAECFMFSRSFSYLIRSFRYIFLALILCLLFDIHVTWVDFFVSMLLVRVKGKTLKNEAER